MKNLLTAIVLSVAANTAAADAFAPWDNRNVISDPAAYSSASVPPVGFAPWRDLRHAAAPQADAAVEGVRMSAMPFSVFRPWS